MVNDNKFSSLDLGRPDDEELGRAPQAIATSTGGWMRNQITLGVSATGYRRIFPKSPSLIAEDRTIGSLAPAIPNSTTAAASTPAARNQAAWFGDKFSSKRNFTLRRRQSLQPQGILHTSKLACRSLHRKAEDTPPPIARRSPRHPSSAASDKPGCESLLCRASPIITSGLASMRAGSFMALN